MKLVVIAALVASLITATAVLSNDSLREKKMSLTIEIHDAKIQVTEKGEVWIDGDKVGDVTKDGEIWVAGEKEGEVTEENEIWKAGEKVGEVTKDGDVWKDGNEVGNVTKDGTIWIDGSREGTFKGGPAKFVAAIVFFEFYDLED